MKQKKMPKLTPEKKNKLQALLGRLNSLEGSLPKGEILNLTERLIGDEVKTLEGKLRDNPTIKALEEINSRLTKFKKDFNLGPVVTELNALIGDVGKMKKETAQEIEQLSSSAEKRLEALQKEISDNLSKVDGEAKSFTKSSVSPLVISLNKLQKELDSVNKTSSGETVSLKGIISGINGRLDKLAKEIKENTHVSSQLLVAARTDVSSEIQEAIATLQKDILNRIGSFSGGNANRNITMNGNSVLGKYTDVNFLNSSTIGWTHTIDENLKRVNFMASILVATGGGSGSSDFLTVKEVDGSPTVGSVLTIRVSNGSLTDDGGGQVTINTSGGATGITRTVSVLSVSSTMGATANTDYTFFPNVGIKLTLPTAINNSNMYTVKNMAASSIQVAAATGQDIDGSTTVLLPTQYESLSFISNGSVWGVTP